MPRKPALLLAASLLSHALVACACADIRTFDPANAVIDVNRPDANTIRSTFGAPAQPESFSLKNGEFLPSGSSSQPEWRVTLLSNRLVHPDPTTWLRVVVLEKIHLNGTGTWRYVLALGCQDGRLSRIFQFTGEGLSLTHLDDTHLALRQMIWTSNDPHASPSRYRDLEFDWNPAEHGYRLRIATGKR